LNFSSLFAASGEAPGIGRRLELRGAVLILGYLARLAVGGDQFVDLLILGCACALNAGQAFPGRENAFRVDVLVHRLGQLALLLASPALGDPLLSLRFKLLFVLLNILAGRPRNGRSEQKN
jgi:hypothetical protein